MTLWTSTDIEKATKGVATNAFEATGISIDTRTLEKGELYIALKGDHLDGHDYVDEAFKAGAVAALVNKEFKGSDGGPLLRVDDTMKALEELAFASRARTKAKIIAVTGSAGKTGTKEMLATLFSAFGKTHASKKSFNNHWGVPLTLANMPEDTDYGVFELGMNHKGELKVLTQQVKPDIAIITTIEPVHIEHFKNADEIAEAKAEIFQGMEKDGIAILNIDNPHYTQLKNAASNQGIQKIISFGEDESADSILIDCSLRADSTKVTANILGEKVKYKLKIPGKHIAMNSLSALSVVKTLQCDLSKALIALETAEPVAGRGNRLKIEIIENAPPITIIDESYNANPASMVAAFKVFEMVEPEGEGRRIAVLGDMLELGRDGPTRHAELVNPLLKAKADLVFCCGAQMDALYQIIPPDWQGAHTKNSQELGLLVAEIVRPGDVILIKGSAGSHMSYVIQALQLISTKEKRHAL